MARRRMRMELFMFAVLGIMMAGIVMARAPEEMTAVDSYTSAPRVEFVRQANGQHAADVHHLVNSP